MNNYDALNEKIYNMVKELKDHNTLSKESYGWFYLYIRNKLYKQYKKNAHDITQDLLLKIIETERSLKKEYMLRNMYQMFIEIVYSKKYRYLYLEEPLKDEENTINPTGGLTNGIL